MNKLSLIHLEDLLITLKIEGGVLKSTSNSVLLYKS